MEKIPIMVVSAATRVLGNGCSGGGGSCDCSFIYISTYTFYTMIVCAALSIMQRVVSRPIYFAISEKLTKSLSPSILVVTDESHMHRGHAGVRDATIQETHFNVEIVSEHFRDKNRVERQRMVNSLLKDDFDNGLHALALSCKTIDE